MSEPTKVELAKAVAGLMTALYSAAGAAHHFGCRGAGSTMIPNTGQWLRCEGYGCTMMFNVAKEHANTIEWAEKNAPLA